MNEYSTEAALFGLGILIAAQTTYLTYRAWRAGVSSQNNKGILIDTSVLMDGRITTIAESGFIPGAVVIPRSVVGELQLLADGGDGEKRERARRGLDVVKQLQDIERITVQLLQDGSKAEEGVDERLLSLAKKHGMKLCTIDFNLNKVAQVEGIDVLNVNELARNLRMVYLPGDKLTINLTTAGSDNHQAVGHLDDGTMVVVEQAKKYIGSNAEIEIIRSLQTAAGRMMFARLADTKRTPTPDSNGRAVKHKPKAKQRPDSDKAMTRQQSSSYSKSQSQPQARASKSRRKTNEDRLIDLVDSQS